MGISLGTRRGHTGDLMVTHTHLEIKPGLCGAELSKITDNRLSSSIYKLKWNNLLGEAPFI